MFSLFPLLKFFGIFPKVTTEHVLAILEVLILVLGWFIAFYFGLRQQRRQLQDSAKLEVYKNLITKKNALDKAASDLGFLMNSFNLPFSDMEFADKSPSLSTKSPFDIWIEYTGKIREAQYLFTQEWLNFYNSCQTWIGAMPNLYRSQNILFIQLSDLGDLLRGHSSFLQSFSFNFQQWKTWDKADITKRTEELSHKFDIIAFGFIADFMTSIHNTLLTPIFGYSKPYRESFNLKAGDTYQILTEHGVENFTPTEEFIKKYVPKKQ